MGPKVPRAKSAHSREATARTTMPRYQVELAALRLPTAEMRAVAIDAQPKDDEYIFLRSGLKGSAERKRTQANLVS